MKKTSYLLIILGLLFAFPTFAADWYVDVDGGTDNETCSAALPCDDLGDVVTNLVQGGDVVYFAGTYSSTNSITFREEQSGSVDAYTTLMQLPDGDSAKIEITDNTIIDIQGDYIKIDGIDLTHGDSDVIDNSGLLIAGDNAVITNNTIFGTERDGIGVYSTAESALLDRNFFYDIGSGPAVNIHGSATVSNSYFDDCGMILQGEEAVVNNNILYASEYSIGGLFAFDQQTTAYIYNNTMIQSGGNRMFFSAFPEFTNSYVEIKNNIFYYGGSDSSTRIYKFNDGLDEGTTLISDYNLIYMPELDDIAEISSSQYDLSEWQALGYDENTITDDPRFISLTEGEEDFHLQVNSAAIDAGAPVSEVTIDMDGESRAYGTGYDIGADERPLPREPISPTTSDITTTSTTVSWTAPETTTTTYTLEYDTAEDFSSAYEIALIADTSQELSSLTAETTYYYRVKSVYTTVYASYESVWESESFTTLGGEGDEEGDEVDKGLDYTPAAKVKNLKVKKKFRKKKNVRVTWKAQKYKTIIKLQKWNKKAKKYKKYKTFRVKKNKKKKIIKQLKPDTKYRVRARKRRTVEGINYFSEWTKWKKFKTQEQSG